MQEFNLDTIGTHLHIIIDTSSPIGEDFSQIETRLVEFDARYSRFVIGNWTHELNIHGRAELDTDSRQMLRMMLELARKTNGYFDPTVWKRLAELGYGTRLEKKGKREKWANGKSFWDYRDIEKVGETVMLHSDIELEFGGIGKWYMLEWIERYLAKHEKYLIDFGGDIYGKGGWQVGLENPDSADEVIGLITLTDGYLACSSGSKRKWGDNHHLINPISGESAKDVLATYIESDSGMMADGYATALCVMPYKLACEMLEKSPHIEGVILSSRGEFYQSKGSQSKLFT